MAGLLPGAGWECVVALARGRRFHDPGAYRRAHPQMETVEIDGRLGTRESRVAAVRHVVTRLHPDIVVPVSLVDPLEAVARAKLEGERVHLLAVLHGLSPPVLRDLRRYQSFLDMAVGVNRLLSRLLRHHVGLPPERSRYLPHAYAAPPGVSPRGARSGEIRLGYVGRLEQSEKRVLDLVGVAKALEARGIPYRLEIAGDGPCRDQLVRELPKDRVRFLGFVPSEELHRSLYPRLDCLMLFSPAEGGPHVIWEAMYHGVVPVTSRFRSCRAENALRDGETGLLFEVGDIAGAAAHVERLQRDRALLEGLSARCRAAAQPRFHKDLWREAWLSVLDATLSRRSACGGDLPPGTSTPSGLLDTWGVPSRASAWVRSVLGRTPESAEPGAEWPHCGGYDPAEAQEIVVLADRLDTVEPDASPPGRGQAVTGSAVT